MQNSLNPIYILCTANLHLRLRGNIFFRTKCILFLTDQKSVCMGILYNIYLTKQSIIFTLHKNVTTSHSSLSGISMVVSELESKELIYIYGSYIYSKLSHSRTVSLYIYHKITLELYPGSLTSFHYRSYKYSNKIITHRIIYYTGAYFYSYKEISPSNFQYKIEIKPVFLP